MAMDSSSPSEKPFPERVPALMRHVFPVGTFINVQFDSHFFQDEPQQLVFLIGNNRDGAKDTAVGLHHCLKVDQLCIVFDIEP